MKFEVNRKALQDALKQAKFMQQKNPSILVKHIFKQMMAIL